jgi:hypothetical protein
MEFTLLELLKIGAPFLAIGGAWKGSQVALNGTRERVKKLEAKSDAQDETLVGHGQSLTRIETKQDMLLKYLENK